MNKRGADYLRQREYLRMHPRATGHPGSKKGYHHKPAGKGSAWRGASRPLRRMPGWKRYVRKRLEEAKGG